MQYVPIKREKKDNQIVFIVNAIPLKNKSKSIVQKIPHPLGSDALVFNNLEEAKDAVTRAGFSYILPDGKKGSSLSAKNITPSKNNYEEYILSTIKNKTNSSNSNVCAAAPFLDLNFGKPDFPFLAPLLDLKKFTKALSQSILDCCNEVEETSDRKSTRLNSSHQIISYAVFCLK